MTQDTIEGLLSALKEGSKSDWLEQGRLLALQGDFSSSLAIFESAVLRFPEASDLWLGWAGVMWEAGHAERSELTLRNWLVGHPDDIGASFLLASLLREQGRLRSAGQVLRELFAHGPHDVETVIRAIETLDDYGRAEDALLICEDAIDAGKNDPRLHAYAGMLCIQLGHFQRTRTHYERALAQTSEAADWNIPLGLACLQKYETTSHADFTFFRELLQRESLSTSTKRAVLFALGKAYDDVADYGAAATYFREANAIAHANSNWPRKHWRRTVEARLAAPPPLLTLPNQPDWTPVFIVGVPRSGTTLLAERLAQFPNVKNRGELGWLQYWEQRLSGHPPSLSSLEVAAARYGQQLRQDDGYAFWYIDKQPLNLLRVDLAMTLWPNARIIHCERNPRDTALSLWMQSFHDTAHDYSYDFGDITTVIGDCRRLSAHWRARYPNAFLDVSYEELVATPNESLAAIAEWLGLQQPEKRTDSTRILSSIATASAWQARQDVYPTSVDRWQRYARYFPELTAIPNR